MASGLESLIQPLPTIQPNTYKDTEKKQKQKKNPKKQTYATARTGTK